MPPGVLVIKAYAAGSKNIDEAASTSDSFLKLTMSCAHFRGDGLEAMLCEVIRESYLSMDLRQEARYS